VTSPNSGDTNCSERISSHLFLVSGETLFAMNVRFARREYLFLRRLVSRRM
jgi:hypothetical protein